jgi:tRNA(adenine34) deaminase
MRPPALSRKLSSVIAADERWMREALRAARRAPAYRDVPVGAVVVKEGAVLSRAHNRREADGDPTAHAEVLAIRRAARKLGSWRLDGCTLYVTLEPCAMCAGAIVLARIPRLVFGAEDPKAGFAGSLGDLCRDPRLNHRLHVTEGILAEACGRILTEFFREKRAAAKRENRTT